MNLNPRILNKHQPFSEATTQDEIQSFFEDKIHSHFPVVKNNSLIGLHTRDFFMKKNNAGSSQSLDASENQKLSHFFIYDDCDVLEVIREFSVQKTNLLPVLNRSHKYLGYYDLKDLMKELKEAPFLDSQGIVLILQKELNNYSFSEVCQIIESNKGKIYGFFVSKLRENHVEMLIKFESHHINETIQLFRNYEYSVLSVHEEDTFLHEFEKRSDYLQKYLKM